MHLYDTEGWISAPLQRVTSQVFNHHKKINISLSITTFQAKNKKQYVCTYCIMGALLLPLGKICRNNQSIQACDKI